MDMKKYGEKSAVVVDMSSGRYCADLYVEEHGICQPYSKAAADVPLYQQELAEFLECVLQRAIIHDIPVQEFLKGKITVFKEHNSSILYKLETPYGFIRYAICHNGERPRPVDFLQNKDLVLRSWSLFIQE